MKIVKLVGKRVWNRGIQNLYDKQDWITAPSYGWRACSIQEMKKKMRGYLSKKKEKYVYSAFCGIADYDDLWI